MWGNKTADQNRLTHHSQVLLGNHRPRPQEQTVIAEPEAESGAEQRDLKGTSGEVLRTVTHQVSYSSCFHEERQYSEKPNEL